MAIKISNEIIHDINNHFGESVYIADTEQFKLNFINLKKAFSKYYKRFNIAYSYKTNYLPIFCTEIMKLGGYAEVVSEMELELALLIGVQHRNIIWNGPIKNKSILKHFLLNGGTVNIDSISEMQYVEEVAVTYPNTNINLGIRCNFDVGDNVLSRFGIDTNSSEFTSALEIIQRTSNITLDILHCHFAKRNIEYWGNRVNGMLSIVEKFNLSPKKIDLGGGLFGNMIDELKNQFGFEIPTYEDYGKLVGEAFNNFFPENGPELIIEPGTALVGDCMNFLCTVKHIKYVRGKYFATLSGSQKNISMVGVNPPIEIFHTGYTSENYENVDFVGYTCIENDVLYKNFNGSLAPQDTVIFKNCGSYSIVMKPPFILPNFAIIEIIEGKLSIVKKYEKFNDIFHTYIINNV